jgi:hypothetical protein
MYMASIPGRNPPKACKAGWPGVGPYKKYPIANSIIHTTKTLVTYLPSRDRKYCEKTLIARSFPINSQSLAFDPAASSRSAKFCNISARCRCRNDGG